MKSICINVIVVVEVIKGSGTKNDVIGSNQFVNACPSSIGKVGGLTISNCNQWVFLGDTTGDGFYTAFQSKRPPKINRRKAISYGRMTRFKYRPIENRR